MFIWNQESFIDNFIVVEYICSLKHILDFLILLTV